MAMRLHGSALAAAFAGALIALGACSTFGSGAEPPPADEGGAMDAEVTDAAGLGDGDAPTADAAESGPAKVEPIELAKGYVNLAGIAANETTVYFTETGGTTAAVHAVPLAGGMASPFAANQQAPSAVVVVNDVVIWSDYPNKSLFWKGITGGNPTQAFTKDALAPVAIAAVGTDKLVIAAIGNASVGDMQLYSSLLTGPSSAGLALSNPFDVAAANGNFYWTESAKANVWTSTDAFDAPRVLFPNEPDCQSIAADTKGVYWTRPASSTVRASVPSKQMDPYDLSQSESAPFSLAADDVHVYWLTMDGKLRRANRDIGLPPETVTQGFLSAFGAPTYVQAIALTSKYVVWITSDGRVLRFDK